MKSALHGKDYACSADVVHDIQQWADLKPQQFFEEGINKLPGRWQRCINHNGEYFENLCEVDN
jgi:hypothetical protein